MTLAKQDHVVQLVAAAVYPVDEVMTVAPGGWPLATRPLAVLVASDQRAAPLTPDRPLRATDVDRHRVLHEEPGDAAVAGPRSAVLEETGRENSVSAPGAPTRPS